MKSREIKVNVIGNKALIQKDLAEMFDQLEQRTKEFTRMTINLCFAYDSLYEIEHAIESMSPSSFSYSSFINHLLIKEPVDVLVRTSNESRLSNFMVSQCGMSYLCILKENWPELGISSFMKIILEYNINYKKIMSNKRGEFERMDIGGNDEEDEENLLTSHLKQV